MQLKYKIGVLFCIAFLLTGFIGGYVYGQSATTYIMGGSLTESNTVTIWVSGSYYFAKDGGTGRVSTSTNITALTNTQIAAMTTGTIFFKDGTYNYGDGYILIQDKKIYLQGESKEGTILFFNGDGVLYSNTANIEYGGQGISDLTIQSTGLSGTGLQFNYVHRAYSNNFNIQGFARGLYLKGTVSNTYTAFHIYNCTVGLKLDGDGIQGCVANTFHGGEIQECDPCLYVISTSKECADNSFFGTILEATESGGLINLVSYGSYVPYGMKFIGAYLENHYTGGTPVFIDFTLENGATTYAFNNLWDGCKFAADKNDTVIANMRGNRNSISNSEFIKSGVGQLTLNVQGDYNVFCNNKVAYTWNGDVTVTISGAHTRFTDNDNWYLQENTGTAYSLAHNGWVAHGLGDSTSGLDPITVLLTPNEDVGAYWNAHNATHFQVGFADASSHTVSWFASGYDNP